MKIYPKPTHFAILFIIASSLNLQAEVLVKYDFTNEHNRSLPTEVASNASAGKIETFGPATGIADHFDNIYSNTLRVERTAEESLTGDVHIDITISAASGYLLNLESLIFNFGGVNSQDDDFTLDYTVQTSAEGIGVAYPIAGSGSQVLSPSGSEQVLYPHIVNLSGIEYAELSSVTIRLNPWTTEETENSIRVADIIVTGNVIPISEP